MGGGDTPPEAAEPAQYPTTRSSGTLPSSTVLRVISGMSWASAVAAIQRSLAPMGVPRSRSVR